MVAQRAQVVEMIEARLVRDDPSWVVDDSVVKGFRNSIRTGVALLPIKTRVLWHEDGSYEFDLPMDGIHRHRAYVAESIQQYPAILEELDDREAELQRMTASANKTDEILHKRALVAARQLFNRDLLALLQGVTICEPVIDEQGTVHAVPRKGPLPDDPLMLMGIVCDHLQARPMPELDWEREAQKWIAEVSARFNRKPSWLRDEVLGVGALINDGVPGKNSTRRAALLIGIRDVGFRHQVLGKLKREPSLSDGRLQFALNWLGCGPETGKLSWLPVLGRSQMQTRLAHNTLDALAQQCIQAQFAAEAAAKAAYQRPAPTAPSPTPTPPAQERSEPFTTVVPNRAGIAPVKAEAPAAPAVPSSSAPEPRAHAPSVQQQANQQQVRWDAAHLEIKECLHLLAVYDQNGGDWALPQAQRDLMELLAQAQGYLARGG